MLGSSTHDTKRSEDVRARLAVLTELASGWRMALRRWSVMNRVESPPSRSDEYHYYQALVGVWPGEVTKDLGERLKAYMLKAAREAKERTSWINPDEDYEKALANFVEHSLANQRFIDDVKNTMSVLAHLGLLVGLSQALVKVASPGVPDYYQGTEIWDFSLVDPDNRRPVDYALRKKLIAAGDADLLKNLGDGRAKMHVIRKGLEVRRQYRALFHGGTYTPLYADGERKDNIIAWSLADGTSSVIAIAPRLFARLMDGDDLAPLGAKAWGAAQLRIREGEYRNAITGETHRGPQLRVAEVLATFPVALLIRA
jgi:(1->4)-alpha-D-glucan 1-alpha-D-glucosylmutase